jgi:hypothetical protein
MHATPLAHDLARRHQADLLAEAHRARVGRRTGDRTPAAAHTRAALLVLAALVVVVVLFALGQDSAAAGLRYMP